MLDFHDPVAAASHLLMAVWSGFAGMILLRLTRRFSTVARIYFTAYVVVTVLLYTASGLYHGLRHDTEWQRELWLRIDRSAIYLLVFGSFFPVFGIMANRVVRHSWTAIMSVLCLIGIVMQATGNVTSLGSIVGYVLIACVGMLTLPWWMRAVGKRGLLWIGTATLLYGLGGAVQAVQWPNPWPGVIGFHEVLHLCDVAATIVHFAFVFKTIVHPHNTGGGHRRYDDRTLQRNTAPCSPAAIISATT
jgi:hemolysin III